MQYKLLALSALVAASTAQNITASSANVYSIESVLETALPSSLVALAETNSAAAESVIATEFAGSNTPTWFASLPTAVQTYIIPLNASASASASVSALASAANATALHNVTMMSTGGIHHKTTVLPHHTSKITHVTHVGGKTKAMSASSAAAASGSSSSSSAGASMPTAIVGAGLAGAVGLVGLLAL